MVDVFHKLAQTLCAVVCFAARFAISAMLAHVGELERDAGVEVCQIAQTIGQRVEIVCGDSEYRVIGLEGYGRAGGVCLTDDFDTFQRMSATVFLHIYFTVAAYFGTQMRG